MAHHRLGSLAQLTRNMPEGVCMHALDSAELEGQERET